MGRSRILIIEALIGPLKQGDVFLTADRRLKQFSQLRVADVLRDDPQAFLAGRAP